MRAEIIKIGNSKGLRIPKAILEQCGFKTFVDLTVEDHTLTIRPHKKVREGWEEDFKRMAMNGDDELLDAEYISGPLDDDEWQW